MITIAERLGLVRNQMALERLDALVVPRADEYLGEYLPEHNERLHWLSGFTGSAGVLIVLRDKAAIFVDGRYTVQVRGELSEQLFEYHHLIEEPHAQWLGEELPAGARVGCDPRLHSLDWYRASKATLEAAGMELVADSDNLVDRCWLDRPAPVALPALLLDQAFTGESSADKRRRIAEQITALGCDAALVFAPDSVSWLLNIRGRDIPQLPVAQSFAMLAANGDVTLFIDPARVPEGLAEHVGEGLQVLDESEAPGVLSSYGGQKVLADQQGANAWTQLSLEQGGAELVAGEDPVLIPKACKNAVELAGTRRAHVRDAVAEIHFLTWLDAEVAAGRLHDEAVLSDKLFSFRARGEHFHEGSFDTISAAGPNAAMCHYNHLNAVPATLTMGSVYLLDSGGQYTDGTTDITRTIAIGDPGPDVRRMYTLVLKGHIALDQARFPAGTTGTQLDVLARQYLWREGFDYDHGTGHGVGVFLSVHEAPQRISKAQSSVALRAGMIVSNEPGYYRDGAYGIRCENLVVVRESQQECAEVAMLEFEAITLVPFDNRLLDTALMSRQELDWLNDYHQCVAQTLAPLLEGAERAWLEQATLPVQIA